MYFCVVERLAWVDDVSDPTMNSGTVEFAPEDKPGQVCVNVVTRTNYVSFTNNSMQSASAFASQSGFMYWPGSGAFTNYQDTDYYLPKVVFSSSLPGWRCCQRPRLGDWLLSKIWAASRHVHCRELTHLLGRQRCGSEPYLHGPMTTARDYGAAGPGLGLWRSVKCRVESRHRLRKIWAAGMRYPRDALWADRL